MRGNCEICGHAREVHRNSKTQQLICRTCERKLPENQEICVCCAKPRHIVKRLPEGGGLCASCYYQVHDPYVDLACKLCGSTFQVKFRRKTRDFRCDSCFKSDPSRFKVCVVYGHLKLPVSGRKAGLPVCNACRLATAVDECVRCHQHKKIIGRGLCARCYARQRRTIVLPL